MSSELALINAAKAGSVTAFTDLVGDYRTRLLRFLVTRCANFADAEDALQDTLIAAYRHLHTYDPRWRFSTWLYRIAIRNAEKIRSEVIVEFRDLKDEECDPLSLCIAHSEVENLWLCARRILSDDVFAAAWLRYAEDMSIRDVSRALDRSESWTKVNLMRARRTLATKLGDTPSSDNDDGSEAYG